MFSPFPAGVGAASAGEEAGEAVRFLQELVELLQEVLDLREEKGRREPTEFEAQLQELEAKLSSRIAEKRRFTDRDNERFARRPRKQRRHLLRFLRVEGGRGDQQPGRAGPPIGGPGPQDGGL